MNPAGNVGRTDEERPCENPSCIAKREALQGELKCGVCWNIPGPKEGVIQCTNGHILCARCRLSLRNYGNDQGYPCPTCRETFTTSVNLFAKQFLTRFNIYESLTAECSSPGCTYRGKKAAVEEHEGFCQYRTVHCPNVIRGKCSWRGAAKELVTHFNIDCVSTMGRQLEDEVDAEFVKFGEMVLNMMDNGRRHALECDVRARIEFKPIVLRDPIMCYAHPFLATTWSSDGRFYLKIYMNLAEEELEEVRCELTIWTTPGHAFTFRLRPISYQGRKGASEKPAGKHCVLLLEHVKQTEHQDKLFDFEVKMTIPGALNERMRLHSTLPRDWKATLPPVIPSTPSAASPEQPPDNAVRIMMLLERSGIVAAIEHGAEDDEDEEDESD